MSRGELWVDGRSGDDIQDALDRANGRTVRLGTGEFRIDRAIQLDDGAVLAGRGKATVLKLAAGANCNILANRKPDTALITVRDLMLDGSRHEQRRPEGSEHVWAMGGSFRSARQIRVVRVRAQHVRQSAFHFYECSGVVVEDLDAVDLGWSGISTSGTDNIVIRRTSVRGAGLDTLHSGIHIDGGTGVFVQALVEECTGNAIMLDSTYRELKHAAVDSIGRRSFRGLSLNGAYENDLRDVVVKGEYTDNSEAGILISNSDHILVLKASSVRNGRYGVLIQGRNGSHDCVVVDCDLDHNPVPYVEHDASARNFFVAKPTVPFAGPPEPPLSIQRLAWMVRVARRRARSAAKNHAPAAALTISRKLQAAKRPAAKGQALVPASVRGGRAEEGPIALPVPPIAAQTEEPTNSHSFDGTCPVCGSDGTFALGSGRLRESFKCDSCNAHLRYQGQAAALVSRIGCPGTRSLAELSEQPQFRVLEIFEPGVLGPLRRYFTECARYETSDYWPDVAPGDSRDGITCQDMMSLTFADDSFDVVVTSDIFEHIRHPMVGFAEVRRVLRPGGLHVFSIPSQLPLRSRTLIRVDTSGDEDVMLLDPAYHLGPGNSQHLVYNEFGRDLIDQLGELGLPTELVRFDVPDTEASRLLTWVSMKK